MRDKYISLATQVRKSPEFQHREIKDIDIGVTLLSLKAGDSLEGAKMILTQSDAVRQWHQELLREKFLKIANGKVSKPKSLDLTVLAQSLRELEKLMAGSEESETITMRYDKSLVAFQLNGSQFLSRRLEGMYPQYRQLLPTQFQREVKVEKKALLSALEFVSVFSSTKQPLVFHSTSVLILSCLWRKWVKRSEI